MGTKDQSNEKAQQAKRKPPQGERGQEPRRGRRSGEGVQERPRPEPGQEQRRGRQAGSESRGQAQRMSDERRQPGMGDEMGDQAPFEDM
ncbi:hypothetical protein ACIP69_07705 [Streptomyces hygroscopicus]|uniref:hypothetical protein n=1 Tax=Streptomyces hygroscopicus TaxID=1912 RepID=UPI0037FB26CE